MKNNVCIIGASVTSCILGIYLKKRGHKVILLEKGAKIGGAWQVDNQGSIFSNIVAPINNNEVKNFSKVVKFLKGYGVKFNKEYQKALFTKRIIKVKSSDFRSLIKNSRKKLNIVYNYEVKNIKEYQKFVKINNKLVFDYIIHPKNVFVKYINIKGKKNFDTKIICNYDKVIKSKHLRFVCNKLNFNKIVFNENGIGPLDRLQIYSLKKNMKIINGRVKLNWKKRNKTDIIREIKKIFGIKKIVSAKFAYYVSKKIPEKSFMKLKNKLKTSKRINYINTNSITEFILENFIKKKFEL
mgnify:CR=1 FL=1|tara:strand:- start:1848 stop:2738 length:891 start_codon:yes stop_codon:yes gene_type:complete